MRSVRVALALGAVLLIAALGVTLTRSPPQVARVNFTSTRDVVPTLVEARGPFALCQAGEVLPAGTTAVNLRLGASLGPTVYLKAYEGPRLIASGEAGSGWQVSGITVRIRPIPKTSSHVRICASWTLGDAESVELDGESTVPAFAAHQDNGRPLPGRIQVTYLRPGHSSWFSLALTVARHMGLGRAGAGSWIVVLAAALMAAVTLLCVRLAQQELR